MALSRGPKSQGDKIVVISLKLVYNLLVNHERHSIIPWTKKASTERRGACVTIIVHHTGVSQYIEIQLSTSEYYTQGVQYHHTLKIVLGKSINSPMWHTAGPGDGETQFHSCLECQSNVQFGVREREGGDLLGIGVVSSYDCMLFTMGPDSLAGSVGAWLAAWLPEQLPSLLF